MSRPFHFVNESFKAQRNARAVFNDKCDGPGRNGFIQKLVSVGATAANRDEHGSWLKIPCIKDNGRHRRALKLRRNNRSSIYFEKFAEVHASNCRARPANRQAPLGTRELEQF